MAGKIGRMCLHGFSVVMLAACSQATPYQPASSGSAIHGGYSQQLIALNHYRVRFHGNSLTSRETVEAYLLYRAAELTIEQGGDWFTMLDVGITAGKAIEHLLFPKRELPDLRLRPIGAIALFFAVDDAVKGAFDGCQHMLPVGGLLEKIDRAGLHRLHRHGDISVP